MKQSMIKMAGLLFVGLVLLSGIWSPASAQNGPDTRSFGLTATIQSGQGNILVPLWLGDKLTLAPGIGLTWTENVGTSITLLLMPRIYLDMRRVAPYISLLGGLRLNMPTIGGNTTDGMVGLGFGGEYFLNGKFSLGVEGQVNINIIDFGGASNMSANTGAAAHANVYF